MNKRIKRIVLTLILLTLAASLNCGSSKQLDRSKAAKMIESSPQFTPVYSMIVAHERDRRYIDPEAAPASAQGEAVAIQNFYDSMPYRGVCRELNLLDIKAKYVGTENGRNVFDLDIRLTDRAKGMWKELGLEPNEATIPLAQRKLVGVTGITGGDPAKGARATAEFDWQWQPTLAGRAMTKGTKEYESLPAKIKAQFDDAGLGFFGIGAKPPMELQGVRHGIASFQLFDDGWRLEPLSLDNRPLNPLD